MKKCIFYKMLANLGKSLKIWFCCRNAQENNFVHRWNWGDNLPLTRNEGSKALDRENQLEYDPIIVWELQREVAGDVTAIKKYVDTCAVRVGRSGKQCCPSLETPQTETRWGPTTPPQHRHQNQSGPNCVHVEYMSGLYVTKQVADVFEEKIYIKLRLFLDKSKLDFGLPGQLKASFFLSQACQLCCHVAFRQA